jgi:very-short-patch-repair endonuclease
MRTSLNSTELLVWSRIRNRRIDGWKFRRQQPIGPYFVDFYCSSARLVVEINGPAHDHPDQWAKDERRVAWLEAQGYRVVRIAVEEISSDLDQVLYRIYAELVAREQMGYTRGPHRPASPATSPQAGKS